MTSTIGHCRPLNTRSLTGESFRSGLRCAMQYCMKAVAIMRLYAVLAGTLTVKCRKKRPWFLLTGGPAVVTARGEGFNREKLGKQK